MTDDPDEVSAAREAAREPEPEWAEQIRALRKERADRLKTLLGTEDEAQEETEP
jgi:hypothetical protein